VDVRICSSPGRDVKVAEGKMIPAATLEASGGLAFVPTVPLAQSELLIEPDKQIESPPFNVS
jgi:hypothetical protein